MSIQTCTCAITRRQVLAQAVKALAPAFFAAILVACGPSGAVETSNTPGPALIPSVAPTAAAFATSSRALPTETPAPTTASSSTSEMAARTALTPTTNSTPPAAATAASCPGGDICDAALGVAISLPPGWQEARPGKYPPGDLALQIPASSGQVDNDLRLQISPWGTTNADAAGAASAGMDRLLQGVNPPPVRTAVQYGGAPGVLVHDPEIQPKGVTAIILAHNGTVLKILAPGKTLAPDQRQALASLRFILRTGPFPASN